MFLNFKVMKIILLSMIFAKNFVKTGKIYN